MKLSISFFFFKTFTNILLESTLLHLEKSSEYWNAASNKIDFFFSVFSPENQTAESAWHSEYSDTRLRDPRLRLRARQYGWLGRQMVLWRGPNASVPMDTEQESAGARHTQGPAGPQLQSDQRCAHYAQSTQYQRSVTRSQRRVHVCRFHFRARG